MKFTIKTVSLIDSTQDKAKEYAQKGEEEGFVLQALEQSKGRGRHGKNWVSQKGNLYMSVILKPECLVDESSQLAFVSALAVSDAIEGFLPSGMVRKNLKWPNDVLVNNKKIAGILIENTLVRGRIEFVTLGIGLNVNVTPQIEKSVCLKDILDVEHNISEVRDSVLQCLARFYNMWKRDGFSEIRTLWLKQAYGIGQNLTVSLSENEIKGKFDGIDKNGWMIVTDKSGNQRNIKSGTIIFD